MTQSLVVFAYSEHFNLAQFVLRRACAHLKNLGKIYIVWDDLYQGMDHDWAQDHFRKLGYTVVRHSQWAQTVNEPLGWIRQQWVKLHLHQQLDEDQWILLDGDTVLNQSYELNQSWTWVSYEHYEPYWQFINHALGLEKTVNHSWVCPLQIFDRSVLTSLEAENLPEKFREWQRSRSDPVPGLSEFEIYGTWASQKMNQKRQTLLSPFIETANPVSFQAWACSSSQDVVFRGQDRLLPNVANWH